MHPLAKYRAKKKLSQVDFAELLSKRMDSTIAPRTICNYEMGVTLPDVVTAMHIKTMTKGAVSLGCWGCEY